MTRATMHDALMREAGLTVEEPVRRRRLRERLRPYARLMYPALLAVGTLAAGYVHWMSKLGLTWTRVVLESLPLLIVAGVGGLVARQERRNQAKLDAIIATLPGRLVPPPPPALTRRRRRPSWPELLLIPVLAGIFGLLLQGSGGWLLLLVVGFICCALYPVAVEADRDAQERR